MKLVYSLIPTPQADATDIQLSVSRVWGRPDSKLVTMCEGTGTSSVKASSRLFPNHWAVPQFCEKWLVSCGIHNLTSVSSSSLSFSLQIKCFWKNQIYSGLKLVEQRVREGKRFQVEGISRTKPRSGTKVARLREVRAAGYKCVLSCVSYEYCLCMERNGARDRQGSGQKNKHHMMRFSLRKGSR